NLPKSDRASCQATSTSGTSYDSHARFVRSAFAVSTPYVHNLTTKRLQHLLHNGAAFSHLPQSLLFETLLVFATQRLAFRSGIFHEDSDAHLPSGDFATCLTDELVVVRPRERLAEMSCLGSKLDTQLAFFEHCRVSGFERRHQQHLSVFFQDSLD